MQSICNNILFGWLMMFRVFVNEAFRHSVWWIIKFIRIKFFTSEQQIIENHNVKNNDFHIFMGPCMNDIRPLWWLSNIKCCTLITENLCLAKKYPRCLYLSAQIEIITNNNINDMLHVLTLNNGKYLIKFMPWCYAKRIAMIFAV